MNDVETIERIRHLYERLREQTARVIVGQASVLEEIFIALLSGGHCLLEGAPGLGKTLMVRTLAESLSLEFQRIQCTPDLMPGDITGSEVFSREEGVEGGMKFVKGPVFTNILLADEINRTPPRTQSALLEAMQEHQVTTGRTRRPLPEPFFVLATQNPIEQEGTYPLPEAQLDRFMLKCCVDYPSRAEEMDILLQTVGSEAPTLAPVLTREELLEAAALVRRVPVSRELAGKACDLCRLTRPNLADGKLRDWVREYVSWGAGPRAGQALLIGSKARAALYGRFCVEQEDIAALAHSVLRHRIQTRFTADAEGITQDDIVQKIGHELGIF
ncbi:MAG: MoxR family ATPase [Planctomycetia bacterium]|nr:MoxR family ATPase [Planctomycetia bacterium]